MMCDRIYTVKHAHRINQIEMRHSTATAAHTTLSATHSTLNVPPRNTHQGRDASVIVAHFRRPVTWYVETHALAGGTRSASLLRTPVRPARDIHESPQVIFPHCSMITSL